MRLLDAMDEGTPLVVEDADRVAYDEKALFHLLNLAREKRLYVLITAESAPSRWGIALPDLKSRLNAVPAVEIGAPDEALIRTVLLKHFTDRQLDIDPKVLDLPGAACGPFAGRRRRRRGGGRPRGAGLGPQDQPPTRHRGACGGQACPNETSAERSAGWLAA